MATTTTAFVATGRARLAGAALEGARAAGRPVELPEVPRARASKVTGAAVPVLPQARRRAHRQKKGVHRDVTDDCVGCHVEHAGVDAELVPLDPKTFNHAAETGFPLDGRHAPLAKDCAKCHKTRSFSDRPGLRDLPRGPCTRAARRRLPRCHSTAAAVQGRRERVRPREGRVPADRRAPHGGVREVPRQRAVQGLDVRDLHVLPQDPHAAPFGAACAHCHTTTRGRRRRSTTRRPRFPLRGQARRVAVREVPRPAADEVKPRRDGAPTATPTRIAGVQAGLRVCHTDAGSRHGRFDHGAARSSRSPASTRALACAKCHKGSPPGGLRLPGASWTSAALAPRACRATRTSTRANSAPLRGVPHDVDLQGLVVHAPAVRPSSSPAGTQPRVRAVPRAHGAGRAGADGAPG